VIAAAASEGGDFKSFQSKAGEHMQKARGEV
jgi:hypothetical protein